MKIFIENGADVNAVDNTKSTALHIAVKKGHFDVAKVLIQNGADVNAVNEYKETPLCHVSGVCEPSKKIEKEKIA